MECYFQSCRVSVFAYLEVPLWSMSEFTTVFVVKTKNLERAAFWKSLQKEGKTKQKEALDFNIFIFVMSLRNFVLRVFAFSIFWSGSCGELVRLRNFSLCHIFFSWAENATHFCFTDIWDHWSPWDTVPYLRPFTSSPLCARTLVSALFVLFCNCYFFLITWMRTNDQTKSLKKLYAKTSMVNLNLNFHFDLQ